MKMLRLPRAKVQLGVPLPWSVRDEFGRLLLRKGHVVDDEDQLDALLQRGAFVDVEEIKAAAAQIVEAHTNPSRTAQPNLFELWRQSAEDLKRVLTDLEQQVDFGHTLDRYADHVIDLLDHQPEIAIYQCVRQEQQHLYYYGYSHSVQTAVLCQLMSRQLDWPEARQRSLVKAALTMNLSILDLQGQMAGQDEPVRDRQRAAILAHPQQAVTLLQQAGINDADWLGAVAQHHEQPDGGTYPKGEQPPSEMAVALRVADVFLAKISPRLLRSPLSPQEAIRQLYREDHGGPLSTAVVKVFGLYPPGDVVRLASGEWAVVVQRTGNAKAPIVATITDTAGQPLAHTGQLDSGQPAHAIVGTAPDNHLVAKMPAERLYGYAMPSADLLARLQSLRGGAGGPVV
ncbi:MAG TPA: HD domain-containing phosphohydrolase [Macromonas sp.]|nr:HD domain-containing phosphohydrolase [Macromonas sp.]